MMHKKRIRPLKLLNGFGYTQTIPSPLLNKTLNAFSFGITINFRDNEGWQNRWLDAWISGQGCECLSGTNQGDRFQLWFSIWGATENIRFAPDNWVEAGVDSQLVFVYDNTEGQGKAEIFVNGVSFGSQDYPTLGDITFTDDIFDSGNGLAGEMYNRFFYERALTHEEIIKMYNDGLMIPVTQFEQLGLADNLLIANMLDEEYGTRDLSGNGHVTTITNATQNLYQGFFKDVYHSPVETKDVFNANGVGCFGTSGKVFNDAGKSWTSSCFIWLDELPTGRICFYGDRGQVTLRYENNAWRSHWDTTVLTSNLVMELHKWYHCVTTVDKDTLVANFYINNVLQDTDIVESVDNVGVYGNIPGDGWGNFLHTGKFVNPYFGNFAFSDADREWFYNNGNPRDFDKLPKIYHDKARCYFEINDVNECIDLTGNGHSFFPRFVPLYDKVFQKQSLLEQELVDTISGTEVDGTYYSMAESPLTEDTYDNFSFSCWVYGKDIDTRQDYFGIPNVFWLRQESGGNFQVSWRGEGAIDTSLYATSDSRDLHKTVPVLVTFTFELGVGAKIYLNGVFNRDVTTNNNLALENNFSDIKIASIFGSGLNPVLAGSSFFSAILYDRTLSQDDISTLYNNGLCRLPEHLIDTDLGDFIFGTSCLSDMELDISGNDNHPTVQAGDSSKGVDVLTPKFN